jgi:glutaredoxin
VAKLELFGSSQCPYTREMREWLEWRNAEFVEYDVETDREALERMRVLAGAQRTIPILIDNGKVIQVGWQGRGCVIGGD